MIKHQRSSHVQRSLILEFDVVYLIGRLTIHLYLETDLLVLSSLFGSPSHLSLYLCLPSLSQDTFRSTNNEPNALFFPLLPSKTPLFGRNFITDISEASRNTEKRRCLSRWTGSSKKLWKYPKQHPVNMLVKVNMLTLLWSAMIQEPSFQYNYHFRSHPTTTISIH